MSDVGWDIRDARGELWPFAVIPWLALIDGQGKAQKLPAMKSWQQTPLGSWQKPDIYTDPSMPDEEALTGLKWRVRPGRGAWRPDWEQGWLTNQRSGLWVVDIDDRALFDAAVERALIAIPRTRCQSTGRMGGMHLLFDGRNLPEEFWRQGGLGNPPWGDAKSNGWVAAEGARHPFGDVYTYMEDWPEEIGQPPLQFARWIMSEREDWRDWLNENSRTGRRAGYRNAASTAGENRNVRLCSLRGILFNKVPEMDDDEIRDALLAANEEFAEPLTAGEMEDTVLQPKPGWVRHQDGLVKPDIKAAVYGFEKLYDLRKTAGGEFCARPAETGTPAVVTEIGDDLGRTVALWWRDAAEAWNENLRKRRQKAAEEKAAAEAAEQEYLESLSRRERAEAEEERLDQAKADLTAAFTEEPHGGEEEDKETEIFPAPGTIDRILFHLRASATRHDPVELHLRVVDGPGYVVVDLADETGSVVLITAGGWQVCDVREVEGVPWFRRSPAMLPQVIPVAPEDVMATQDESDFWCQMHTGASDQVRKLHSDNVMLSYSYRRIGMGTSLTLPAGFQADALRRLLHIKLAGTDDHPDSEVLWSDYNRIKPRVMGAIFTLIAEVLKHLPKAVETTLIGVPEMSDFARRLKAVDLALPGLELYESYRQHSIEVLVAAGLEDPLALLVLRLMDKQGDKPFSDSPSALLAELRKAAGLDVAEKWFPSSVIQLGHKLTVLDGPLRRLGIVVERGPRTKYSQPYVITKVGGGDGGNGGGDGSLVITT